MTQTAEPLTRKFWFERRRKLIQQSRQTKDKLGLGLDRRISKTVVALWELRISTTMSCEGHADHGFDFPWIDIPNEHEKQIRCYLATFYDRYPADEHARLGLRFRADKDFRLCNYNLNLKAAQAEMLRFTRFLRKLMMEFFDKQEAADHAQSSYSLPDNASTISTISSTNNKPLG